MDWVGRPNLMTGVHMRWGTFRHTRRAPCVMEVEMEVTHQQAKERQELPTTTRSQGEAGKGPVRAFKENVALFTPWFQTSGPQNCERISFSYFDHQTVGITAAMGYWYSAYHRLLSLPPPTYLPVIESVDCSLCSPLAWKFLRAPDFLLFPVDSSILKSVFQTGLNKKVLS